MGLVAPPHVGSSQTRARTRVPCIGRWILNHCATREVTRPVFLIQHCAASFTRCVSEWVNHLLNLLRVCAHLFLGSSFHTEPSMSCESFEVALCSWAESDSLRSSILAISMLVTAEGTKELCCHSSKLLTSRGTWSCTLWRAAGPPSHSQRSMCPSTGS